VDMGSDSRFDKSPLSVPSVNDQTDQSGISNVKFFLKFLYTFVGLKLFVWVGLVLFAAVLDGLAVGMFLPILQGENPDSAPSRILVNAFNFLGLDYTLKTILIAMVIVYLFRSVFMVGQNIYIFSIITRLLVEIKSGLVRKIFHAKYGYFVQKESGYFINAATIEYNRISIACEKSMNLVVQAGFAVVYFLLPLAVNWTVTVVVLVLGLPLMIAVRKANKLTTQYSIANTSLNTRLQSYLIQAFRNYKYLKATFSTKNILVKTDQTTKQQGVVYYKQHVLNAIVSNTTELISMFLVVGVLFYYVEIRSVQLLEVLFLLFLLRRAVGHALALYQEYRKFLRSSGSIKVFLGLERDLQVEREDVNTGGATPDFQQSLVFDSVHFQYQGSSEVLKNVNILIPPRKTVAIVGASGAGKSTLATLLTGIIKPTSGLMRLGDVSYGELNQIELRKRIGYVTQESVIFNTTVRNNFTLWDKDITDDAVKSVADKAYIYHFIEKLPNKFETQLGDAGMNISGGQRQRISIARELLKDVELLIFDEATSALDSNSEREIQRNIDDLHGSKTIVIIAHRISTIRNSDLVYVLKDGEVIEQGSYQDLIDIGQEFKSMVDQQALGDKHLSFSSEN
tara:strand:+ start:14438 stop:16306 length:1869 start_codon:yes stop_codon:yes gene_type:complete